jgi:hypothetical protein
LPSTACAVPGPSSASAPMHTLPSSAGRRDRVHAPGGTIRMAASPVETPEPGRSAECVRAHSPRPLQRHGRENPAMRDAALPPPRLTWPKR